MYKNSFELQVFVNGKPVREHQLNSKAFIEARRGTQYTLKLKNNTHRRGLAIFSVDGVDVLSGKKSGDADSGYIVNAYNSIEIKGFRVDDDNVSAFVFDDKSKSYSNVVGATKSNGKQEHTTVNCGVIGVRVVLEEIPLNEWTITTSNWPFNVQEPAYRPQRIWYGNYSASASGPVDGYFNGTIGVVGANGSQGANGVQATYNCCVDNLPSMERRITANCSRRVPSEESPDFNLGTTWGQKINDSVTEASFSRSSETFDIVIYYDDRDSLIKAGVDLCGCKKVAPPRYPQPFGESKYCKIPSYR